MKGKKHSYPVVEGRATIRTGGREYLLLFRERTLNIKGNGEALSALFRKIPVKARSLRAARKGSLFLSRLGFAVVLNDERGALFSAGRGVWTPLGRLSVKPRMRRYLKQD